MVTKKTGETEASVGNVNEYRKYNDKDDVLYLYEVTCHDNSWTDMFYRKIVLPGDEPEFTCQCCATSHKHFLHMVGTKTQYSPKHSVKLLGTISINELQEYIRQKEERKKLLLNFKYKPNWQSDPLLNSWYDWIDTNKMRVNKNDQ